MAAKQEKSYPSKENIDRPCIYWGARVNDDGCGFPKAEIAEKVQCKGVITKECISSKTFAPKDRQALSDIEREAARNILAPKTL